MEAPPDAAGHAANEAEERDTIQERTGTAGWNRTAGGRYEHSGLSENV